MTFFTFTFYVSAAILVFAGLRVITTRNPVHAALWPVLAFFTSGAILYTDYVYPFEIAAVVLLVAIIAAIALTHRKRKATRYQDPALQARVRREDRVRIVRMPAEKSET